MEGALKQSTLLDMITMIHNVEPKLLEAVQDGEEQGCLLHVVVDRSVAIPLADISCRGIRTSPAHSFGHALAQPLTLHSFLHLTGAQAAVWSPKTGLLFAICVCDSTPLSRFAHRPSRFS